MKEELHAQVKEVFAEVIRLNPSEVAVYLERRCGNNRELKDEVESLLRHHASETILADQRTAEIAPAVANRRAEKHRDERNTRQPDEFPSMSMALLGEPGHLTDETQRLLRHRLVALTSILSIGLAFGTIGLLFNFNGFGFAVRGVSFIAMFACFAVLRSRFGMSLGHLRTLELAVLAIMGAFAILIDVQMMTQAAREADLADVVVANDWNHMAWAMIIMIYGVFMPNTWQRAAMILLPIACVPYVLTFVMCLVDERIANLLVEDRYGMPVPMPFLAAITSIYAAHIIHSVRTEAFRAKQLAQYKLKRLIGKGGMGEVYEAEHTLMKRPCAIKLIRSDRYYDTKSLARFEREVKATASLSHPNTIEVYDYGETADGRFFYVMELLPGMSLAELVQRHSPLPANRAIHILLQVCGALREAHENGLIHRDIKPANIFAAERGGIRDFAKLLDFGLVREICVDTDAKLTAANMIAGTPEYMSPEQATGNQKVDGRSDIYSLGAVAYFLLTGHPPFQRDSAIATILAHINDSVTPPAELEPSIPNDLETVVLRCLERNAEDRFQDVKELEIGLSGCDVERPWTEKDAVDWWHELPKD